ncbi:hypothetical protein BDK51DRAFT_43791 [Blyttiomyces helicus]|uniref:Uncharacterized protein n=1 Tax=Blyttiomyces helicus TaxID=388810 RepID=A0A4V1IQT1_9FUNG|nr:hypothetical protein BDK51DRAFT_43791 [Blyttiomyces helicus]|eukprot:RKO87637.1 hypothetical protein BDK51DRAFT_43791 [Blyttiomyces helicus]
MTTGDTLGSHSSKVWSGRRRKGGVKHLQDEGSKGESKSDGDLAGSLRQYPHTSSSQHAERPSLRGACRPTSTSTSPKQSRDFFSSPPSPSTRQNIQTDRLTRDVSKAPAVKTNWEPDKSTSGSHSTFGTSGACLRPRSPAATTVPLTPNIPWRCSTLYEDGSALWWKLEPGDQRGRGPSVLGVIETRRENNEFSVQILSTSSQAKLSVKVLVHTRKPTLHMSSNDTHPPDLWQLLLAPIPKDRIVAGYSRTHVLTVKAALHAVGTKFEASTSTAKKVVILDPSAGMDVFKQISGGHPLGGVWCHRDQF